MRLWIALLVSVFAAIVAAHAERPPNLVLVITDDQGYPDLGAHGHPLLKTPHLDQLHAESVRLERFYVSPVCSPTRASLMTGRYNYRTGVVDTYIGRSMMHASENTLAEVLASAGYRTGIFGKWHLGDNYPLWALDQGFQEALVHQGGGIGQPSDPPESDYFDPWLRHNRDLVQREGFCTDIFAAAAIDFIEANREQPFFVYLATNAPHSPYVAPYEYKKPYLDAGLDYELAAFYGMITNIDDNVGKILAKLDELGLREDTLFVFMTDNGSSAPTKDEQFLGGLRGKKGTPYEGGIHVPCFLNWPGTLEPKPVDALAAHIDLLPTLTAAVGVERPAHLNLDGRNLWPVIAAGEASEPDRALVLQWHRGDEPEPYNNAAVVTRQWKLVKGDELYDLAADPGETDNVAEANADVVARLRDHYEAWFERVGSSRGYAPPRIFLCPEVEPETLLTPQDWRGSQGWPKSDYGHWEVFVPRAGRYTIELDFLEPVSDATAEIRIAGKRFRAPVEPGATTHTFTGIELEGDTEDRLSFLVEHPGENKAVAFARVTKE